MRETEKILIVDGHGLAFRAFYAVPPLSAPDGTPTNAITGFMNMLARVEEDLAPGRTQAPRKSGYPREDSQSLHPIGQTARCSYTCVHRGFLQPQEAPFRQWHSPRTKRRRCLKNRIICSESFEQIFVDERQFEEFAEDVEYRNTFFLVGPAFLQKRAQFEGVEKGFDDEGYSVRAAVVCVMLCMAWTSGGLCF